MSDHEEYDETAEPTEEPQEEPQEEEVEQEVEVEVEQVEGSKVVPPPAVTYDVESWRGLARPAAAEFLGSAMFIFIACGSAMTTTNYKNVGSTNIGIALTFGFTIATLCWTIGHISGAHLNFAVTFAFTMLGRISLKRCFMYFMGQFLGGLIGIAFLKLVTPAQWGSNCFAANLINGDLTVGHAFVTEFILTFMLMFVVMAATDPAKVHQTLVPIAIGMAVFIAHMIAIPITGTSINPTRSFASAAAASNVCADSPWSDHWVFWLAPISGATLAAFVYEMVFTAGGGKVGDLMDQYKRKKAYRAE